MEHLIVLINMKTCYIQYGSLGLQSAWVTHAISNRIHFVAIQPKKSPPQKTHVGLIMRPCLWRYHTADHVDDVLQCDAGTMCLRSAKMTTLSPVSAF